jgi:hypothetical protein
MKQLKDKRNPTRLKEISNMNHHAPTAALGIDVGTSRIVVASRSDQNPRSEIGFQSQLNAFVTIPHTKMTEGALQREKVPHTVQSDWILVHGNESEKFADLLNADTRRPMTRGLLDPKEPESLSVLRQILASMLEKSSTSEKGSTPDNPPANGATASSNSRPKLRFTVPAPPPGSEESLTYHETTLRQVFSGLGYDATSINEGLAVVYGELESTNYTGIGISCGGGLCNVCLAYLSVPVLSFSVPKAGDFIDSSAASVTGERANRIRLAKEDSFHFNGIFADKTQQVISVYYDDMILSLVSALREAFARSANVPKFSRPIPIVLSGGSVLPPGFRDRFEKLLREQDFPIQVSEIRLAENPLYSTAKGALACALSDL